MQPFAVNFNGILKEIYSEVSHLIGTGTVANYIPELARISPHKFGIHIRSFDGKHFSIGDHDEKFSIQSISKVLAVALAFSIEGKKLWTRVGVEPSGTSFNSLIQLEYENGIPRNPLINSGALVIADVLTSLLAYPKEDFLSFVRKLAENENIHFNLKVAESEKEAGYRNAALTNFLKSYGNINNRVEAVLDFYYHMCSIEMSCQELADAFFFLANKGRIPSTGESILNGSQTKRLNALMQTCGFYDEAGEFSFKVGLPGKSGVGGGIVAIHPGQYSVAVWGPGLNAKGNSIIGMKALELLTTKLALSIF